MRKGVVSNTHSYLIIGCGHFGSQAIRKLLKKNPHSKIIVVDKNERAIEKASSLRVEGIVEEGISFLHQFLLKDQSVDYIIPAVPFHLAFEFTLSQLQPLGGKRSKVPSLPGLPNPLIGKTGDLYTSLANFLCPEDCPEPSQYCTVTKKKRRKPLYKILMDLSRQHSSMALAVDECASFRPGCRPTGASELYHGLARGAPRGPFESRVIRSQQLGLGVGGFEPGVLIDLVEDIKKRRDPDRLILISTACRCHGVTSALSF